MKKSVRNVSDKPDISFSAPNDHRFPTPQEFDAEMSKRGHFYVDKPKLSVGQIIVSVICILGVFAAVAFAGGYLFDMQPDAELADRYGRIAGKLMTLHKSLADDIASGDQAKILSNVGVWSALVLSGLLAGSADLLISRVPINGQITSRFGFGVNPLMRFLPSMTVMAYMLFRTVVTSFVEGLHFDVDLSNFSIKGEGYTWEMWVTQGMYILVFFACIFMIYETFANSGIFGMVVRLPLAVISNGAVVMLLLSGTAFVIVVTLAFILIKAVGVILSISLPDHSRFYRE